MKPSEYLFNEAINSVENRKKDFYLGLLEYNEFGEDISTYKFNRKQEKELDKRYIDREELKKVLKKLSEYYHENWDWPGSVFTEEYNEKILELLK